MSYFSEIYLKRLNRYGIDHKSRIQGQREYDFDCYLNKTVYRIDFTVGQITYQGSFEPYSQDNTQTLTLLLTENSVTFSNGTILMLPNKEGVLNPWMVYWKEDIVGKGYNTFMMLKMTQFIEWKDSSGNSKTSWAYFYGKEDAVLKNEIKSKSGHSIFEENSNSNFFIMPTNVDMKREVYFEVGTGALKEGYRVTGYDIRSTPGVQYVTVDPAPIRDNTSIIIGAGHEEFYWITGDDDE